MKRISLSVAFVLSCSLLVASRQAPTVFHRSVKVKRASYAPKLTGTLTNPVWRDATVFTDFHQVSPRQDGKASARTAAYVMYDQDNVYIGVRMSDASGSTDADSVTIYFDPTGDHKHAAYFQVMATGTQSNGTLGLDGRQTVTQPSDWQSAAKKIPGGWAAEMTIPLKTLNIRLDDKLDVGFKVLRVIGSTKEVDAGPGPFSDGPNLFSLFAPVRFWAYQ